MYKAHLSDPIHGEATVLAEEAVELAFQQLAESWMHPDDRASWPAGSPMFDGEIRGVEVWWCNRAWGLIGTVQVEP